MLDFIFKGGWLMVPLLTCSGLALAIVITKAISLRILEARSRRFSRKTQELMRGTEARKIDKVQALCDMTPNLPLASILNAGIRKQGRVRREVQEAIEHEGTQQVPRVERYLKTLGTVATISPLLGLLGTVVGMIRTFDVIAAQGVGDPGALAGGISEALITTAVGLSIAIPSLVFYNYFMHRSEKIIRSLEAVSNEFMDVLVTQDEDTE